MILLSDNPISSLDEDLWGLDAAAADLHQAIQSARSLPLTLGVFGPWGSGKTSLLRLLQLRSAKDDALEAVWFNAWKYQRREEVWPALVQAVLLQLADRAPRQIAKRALVLARAAGRVFAGRATQVLTSGVITAQDVDGLLARLSDEDEANARLISGFDSIFDGVVTDIIGDRRLVVLIDDLDRCDARAALEVLEGIKLFLANDSCVFVVALDVESLLAALKDRVHRDDYFRVNYLEKLIQVGRYVPAPSPQQLRASLENLTGTPIADQFWFLVESAAAGNPRRAKRFVSTLSLAGSLAQEDGKAPLDRLLLAKLLVLRVQFPAFYSGLATDPGLWSDLERRLEGTGEDSSRLAPWLMDARLCEFFRRTGPRGVYVYPAAPASREVVQLLRRASDCGEGLLSTAATLPAGLASPPAHT